MSPLLSLLLWQTLSVGLEPALPALVASRLAWRPFSIPSGAMKPTLLVGDYVVVRTIGDPPRRGDVVVFRHPVSGAPFIKRLVGLPGDRIQMIGGVLHLNGEPAPQEPAGTSAEDVYPARPGPDGQPACRSGEPPVDGACAADRLLETLPPDVAGGAPVVHAILDLGTLSKDDTAPVVVPPGHFFVLGDNRDNSIDSRFDPVAENGMGFVPQENVIGTAILVAVSTTGPDPLDLGDLRLDRLLERVR